MPSRWGFEGAIAAERLAVSTAPAWNIDLNRPDLTSLPDFLNSGRFQCALAQMASDSIAGAWGFTEYAAPWFPSAVLFAMTLAMLAILLIALRRRDPV
jgi:hypothetical protein